MLNDVSSLSNFRSNSIASANIYIEELCHSDANGFVPLRKVISSSFFSRALRVEKKLRFTKKNLGKIFTKILEIPKSRYVR